MIGLGRRIDRLLNVGLCDVAFVLRAVCALAGLIEVTTSLVTPLRNPPPMPAHRRGHDQGQQHHGSSDGDHNDTGSDRQRHHRDRPS